MVLYFTLYSIYLRIITNYLVILIYYDNNVNTKIYNLFTRHKGGENIQKQKISKQNNYLVFAMVLIGLFVIFSYGMGNVSAASGNSIYVNGSSGNDTYNGLNSTWTSGLNGPKATIKNATGTVNSNGTIYIANGQYTGTNNTGITINQNMTIIGENQQNTIINAQGNGDIFNIPTGVNVTLINLSLINGKVSDVAGGGAIGNSGTLNLINCTFTNNYAGIGGAINNWGGTLNVNNCTFNNNTAYSEGGAIYFPSVGGTININNSTFTNNTGTYGGGAILSGGTLNVSYSTFTYNKVVYNWGGAIWNVDSTCNVNFSRIVGNTAPSGGSAIFNEGTTDATNNWWGSNINPKLIPNLIVDYSGSVNTNTWVILTVNATPATINNGGTSTITADFNHVNGGNPLTGGNIPDGIPVTFTTAWGSFTQSSATTINGQVTTTFQAIGTSSPNPNPVQIYAHADDENNVNTPINIILPTNTTVNIAHNFAGQNLNITANVNDYYNNPVNGGKVTFTVGSEIPVTVFVVNGVATLANWTIPNNWNVGTYTITATYDETDTNYANSTNSSTLTVDQTPTKITVEPIHNYPGQSVNLTSNVNDYYNNPMNGGQVNYTVNNIFAGTATVNNGIATLSWTIPNNWNVGTYTITATYDGTGTNYANSTNSSTLTIDTTPTNVTVKNVTGIDNQTVILNATLTDTYGNLLAGQTVFFSVNGHNYSAVTDNNGIATINYIPYGAGNYNVTVNYNGNDNYTASEGTGLLTVNPSAYLYLQITASNKNPKIGETFTLTYKLGNKGPDNATNVTITIPLPSGFIISNISGDGNWTYNPTTHTITWTLTNVTIGDPYLYITGKTNNNGVYIFGSSISSETYNLNTEGVEPITINTTNPITPKKQQQY